MSRRFQFLFILILGLIPLLWFKGEKIVLGHDSGLTLSPVSHFLDRLYVWTERFGFGSDQSFALPGFFIHGLEALISYLGFDLQASQKIVFIFWFVLPGITMFYFASKLEKKFNITNFALPASVFYMINHFLLQGWFIAERGKFSLYAALPLIALLLFDWEENKRNTLKTAIIISLVLLFLNGLGSLPLFGGIIAFLLVFLIYYFIKETTKKRIFRLLRLALATLVASLALNAYWVLPFGYYVLNNYQQSIAQAGGFSGILGWISYISQDTSVSNLFRLQGIPEWYQNPLHPYANNFLNNPVFILISFLIPLSTFLTLHLYKKVEIRKYILFFALLALVSIVFAAGSHPPFGALYIFLVNFVPGFIAFRTPFYKFAPALWFAYAVLIGFSISYIVYKIGDKSKLAAKVFLLLLVSGIVIYSSPFLNGSFFDYIVGERSMRVSVPDYIYEFGKWSESKEMLNDKILVLPPPNFENKIDAYEWGYWSPAPLTSLLSNASIVNESHFTSKNANITLRQLYTMMVNDEFGWENLAKSLGIQFFLLRNDFSWDLRGSPTYSPDVYEEILKNKLELVKNFGQWDIYKFKDTSDIKAKIGTSSKLNYVVGSIEDLKTISSLQVFDPLVPIYFSNLSPSVSNPIDLTQDLYIVSSCARCNLQYEFLNTNLYTPLITRGSIFYDLLKGREQIEQSLSVLDKVRHYSYRSLSSLLGIQKVAEGKKDISVLLKSIDDYNEDLKKLNKVLKEYIASSKDLDNLSLLDLDKVLRVQEIIFLNTTRNFSDFETLDKLNLVYLNLKEIRSFASSNTWQTLDETRKRLIFDVPIEGDYSIFYRRDDGGRDLQSPINISVDGNALNIGRPLKSSNWLSLGEVELSEGVHKVEIEQSPINLYRDSSPIELTSPGSCFRTDNIGSKKDEIYRISFNHRRLSGNKNFYAKFISSDRKINPIDASGDVLSSTFIKQFYTNDYTQNNDKGFYLAICSYPEVDEEIRGSTSIEVSDINIRKIDVPDLVFYKNLRDSVSVPISYDRKNQTEYLFSNKEQPIIWLNETYSTSWRVDQENSEHFMMNGYANAWVINNKSQGRISYIIQDYFSLGSIISIFSFVAALMSLTFMIVKKYD